MDVCFENSCGAPRENSNMQQGSYLRGQTPRKDCDYVLLGYVVKWGYESKFSKLGFEYAAKELDRVVLDLLQNESFFFHDVVLL